MIQQAVATDGKSDTREAMKSVQIYLLLLLKFILCMYTLFVYASESPASMPKGSRNDT